MTQENSATKTLAKFIHLLRHMGVRVSTAESLDAMQALPHVNLLKKSQVKDALRAALIKNYEERQIFDLAFDRFFVKPEEKQQRLLRHQHSREEWEKGLQKAENELMDTLKEWKSNIPDNLQPSREQLETFRNMPDEERRRLKELLSRMQGNPVNNPGELIARVMQSSLNYWRYYMLKNLTEQDKYDRNKLQTQLTGIEELDEVIEGVSAEFYHQSGDEILNRDMQWIDESQLNAATAIIKRMSSKLATRLSHRYQRTSRARNVDIRRTIRHNMRYGGTPLQLCYRSRRLKKTKLVLICDVSASMAKYARFVLQFIYGLSGAVKDIETFIFSENLEWVTPYFRVHRGFHETMAEVMNQSNQWGRATNLYSALLTLKREHKSKISKDCIVFVVSDAKTISFEQAAVELSRLSTRCKEIFWLNPLPVGEWKNVKGIKVFQQMARMIECNTLAQLDKAIRKQILKSAK